MEINELEINNHRILKAKYAKDELINILKEAEALAKKVSPFDPSGTERDFITRNIKNIGGLLAEKVVIDIAQQYANEHKCLLEIKESNWKEAESSLYQIDHIFSIDSKIKTIETRSSFSYKTKCPERVVTGAFSIIGPYVSEHKIKEIEKDFYAFVFYCMNPQKLPDILCKNNFIEVYFAGGASISMFSETTTLKQKGAEYKIIKPITAGLDATAFFQKLFS